MNPLDQFIARSRRNFLTSSASGLGLAAMGSMLDSDGLLSAADGGTNPLAIKPPHFAPTAKRCIFLFQAGAPSHLDLYSPKPKLNALDGQPLPKEMLENVRFEIGRAHV